MNAKLSSGLVTCFVLAGCSGSPPTPGEIRETVRALAEAPKICVDLPSAGDATISAAEMRKNFGSSKVLRVGERAESLLAFDLGSIPATAAVESATLKLYVSDSDHGESIDVHRVTAPWSESTVTFASFAQRFDRREVGSLSVSRANVQKSVDLTDLAKEWLRGARPNDGILLDGTRCRGATFVSREGGTPAQKPALRVCYTKPVDHCAPSNPCQNGGTCENAPASYVCHCAPAYSGASCETNIDDCASNPCENGGVCQDSVAGYACACPAGYVGRNCEINVDDCAPNPCQNAGVCEDGAASYTCHCPPGYTGARCETPIDRCASAPCQNGGACTSSPTGYTCACAAGFTGLNCEIDVDDCAAQPCKNGGTCVDHVAGYTCVCPPDWGGAACEVNLNTCAQAPCLNDGTCVNGVGTYTCTCVPGFSGANCEVDVNDCAPHPCANGGVCVDGVHAFTCTCPAGFTGPTCTDPTCNGPCSPAAVTVTPGTSHDFGSVAIFTARPFDFTIQNTGQLPTAPITSVAIGPDLPHFQVTDRCNGVSLSPGANCTISVAFTPTTTGAKSAGWRLTSSGIDATLSFGGSAVNPASIAISPSGPVNLGSATVGATGASQAFTISNAPNQGTTGPLFMSVSNTADFSMLSSDCTELAGGQSCTVKVALTPTTKGPVSTNLVVVMGGQQVQAALSGSGTCPPGLTGTHCESVLDFCSPNPCQNGGACVNGPSTATCTCAAGFTGLRCQWFVCGAGAPDGSPCNDGNACTKADACAAGVCIGGDAVVCAAADACHDPGACAPSTGQCDSPLKSTCSPATLVVTQTGHDFGGIVMMTTSAPYTFSVQNTGDVPTGAIVAVIGGADSNQFLVSNACNGADLSPGEACAVTVTFLPMATGAKSASVSLFAAGASTVLALNGTGVNQALLALSPTGTIDLGSAAVGQTGNGQTFTISNAAGQATTGPIAIAVSRVNDFTLASPSCPNLFEVGATLPAGASCTFRVLFTPHSAGPFTGQLFVVASPGGTQTVNLVGRGL